MKRLKTSRKQLVAIAMATSFICGSHTLYADQFLSLSSVRFLANTKHMDGNKNITSVPANGSSMTTTLPINLNSDLNIQFNIDFSGQSKHGNVEFANITPITHANIVNCVSQSLGNSTASKNKTGKCTARKNYLNELNSQAQVRIRFNSPGGGGNRFLTWTINPSPVQNEIDRVVPPPSIRLDDLFSGEIILARPATSRKTIRWALNPKGCFSGRSLLRDNSDFIGSVTFQPGEIQRTVEIQSQTSGCKSTSGKFKAWWNWTGRRAKPQPSKQRGFRMIVPRN